jgi:hypothetical protein
VVPSFRSGSGFFVVGILGVRVITVRCAVFSMRVLVVVFDL